MDFLGMMKIAGFFKVSLLLIIIIFSMTHSILDIYINLVKN